MTLKKHQRDPFYGDRVKWTDNEAFAGLPQFCYLHSMDQLRMMIAGSKKFWKESVHRVGVDEIDVRGNADKLHLINIGDIDAPEWVCDHKELKRWMKRRGIPAYTL